MTRTEIEELLRGIIVKNSRVGVRTVEDDHLLVRDAGLDSLGLVGTLAEVEERLGITFPVEKLEELGELTFRGLVQLALEAAGGKGRP
jgi:acyl carrier protein